jgi:hypothetical protein
MRLGADVDLLAMLADATEADYLLTALVDADAAEVHLAEHPLGSTVLTHTLTDLIAWAITGQVPGVFPDPGTVVRRGPVPSGPALDVRDRQRLFANLHVLAERAGRPGSEHLLLHRQACFLAGLDPTGGTAAWIRGASPRSTSLTAFHTWSPRWPDVRSVATSLAKQGDAELLRDFIARAHPDETCELAGLNYWAYWVGEIASRQRDDLFMIKHEQVWRGGRLLRHLVDRLDPSHPFIDLNIHTIWTLLKARTGLAYDEPRLARDLLVRGARVHDGGAISAQSRQEIGAVLYGLRVAGPHERGRRV